MMRHVAADPGRTTAGGRTVVVLNLGTQAGAGAYASWHVSIPSPNHLVC